MIARATRYMAVALVAMALLAGTGCANLSLFSSTHTHYYDTKETKERLEKMELRLTEMEQYRQAESAEEQ